MTAPSVPSVVLVGTSGYALRHLQNLIQWHRDGVVRLVALVDVAFADATRELLASAGVTVAWASTLGEAFEHGLPDIAVVATPPQTHYALARQVREANVALYLEKPPVPLLQQFDDLAAVATSKRFDIGFQETRQCVETAAAVIAGGTIGAVVRVTAHGALARPDSYYERSPWAGLWFSEGQPVLDGPLFNPLAHIVHSALSIARLVDARWAPDVLDSEFYSVRQIDGDDLGAVRVSSVHGPLVVAVGTTAADVVEEPAVTLHGERGSATIRHRDGQCVVTVNGVSHHMPSVPVPVNALLRAVTQPDGVADPLLDSAAVRPFVMVVNAAVQAAGEPHRITHLQEYADRDGATYRWLPGVSAAIASVTSTGRLFSELDLDWSVPPASLALAGYAGLEHPLLAADSEFPSYDDRRGSSQSGRS